MTVAATGEPVRVVAAKIIRAGYRALALKNHPDQGGAPTAMLALNHAKDWLEHLVNGQAPVQSSWDDLVRQGAAERTRRREASRAQEAQARQRQAERARRQAEAQATYAACIRIAKPWVHIDGVTCVNQNPKSICCTVFGKIHWIPETELHKDSQVRHRGDTGTMIIAYWLARHLGIVHEEGT